MVICHPGEVARCSGKFFIHWANIWSPICHNFCPVTDEDLMKSMKVPCILHMDSIKGSHGGLKNLIQRYSFVFLSLYEVQFISLNSESKLSKKGVNLFYHG